MTNGSTAAEQLADFLRSRRAALVPADLGVVTTGLRRVPGLRREELAELAGVSLTYYTRLEQGAASNPSTQVIDALARALRLDEVERAHLYHLAGSATPRPVRSRMRPGLATLLDAMPDVAAIALSPVQDIVGWNRLGHAVLASHLDPAAPTSDTPPNKVSMLFTDPATRALHRDWEFEARLAVASLRYVTGPLVTGHVNANGANGANDDIADLVSDLASSSADFARIWAQHPVESCSSGTKRFRHPLVGELDLTYDMLHLPQEDGHRLMLMHATPGSSHDDALRLLASTTLSG